MTETTTGNTGTTPYAYVCPLCQGSLNKIYYVAFRHSPWRSKIKVYEKVYLFPLLLPQRTCALLHGLRSVERRKQQLAVAPFALKCLWGIRMVPYYL